jgi:hypothetical protein
MQKQDIVQVISTWTNTLKCVNLWSRSTLLPDYTASRTRRQRSSHTHTHTHTHRRISDIRKLISLRQQIHVLLLKLRHTACGLHSRVIFNFVHPKKCLDLATCRSTYLRVNTLRKMENGRRLLWKSWWKMHNGIRELKMMKKKPQKRRAKERTPCDSSNADTVRKDSRTGWRIDFPSLLREHGVAVEGCALRKNFLKVFHC